MKRTFDDERVLVSTHLLARQFMKRRKLTGEEATAIIEEAWKKANKEHGEPRTRPGDEARKRAR